MLFNFLKLFIFIYFFKYEKVYILLVLLQDFSEKVSFKFLLWEDYEFICQVLRWIYVFFNPGFIYL